MINKLKIFFYLIVLSLSSCYPFVQKRSQPTTNFCFFDTKKNTINCTSKQIGIIRLQIYKVEKKDGFNSSYVSTYIDKEYVQPISQVDLTEDTLFLKNNRWIMKIWDKKPTLESYYWIEMNLEDWKQNKLVYARYNTR